MYDPVILPDTLPSSLTYNSDAQAERKGFAAGNSLLLKG